jgi:hypothetical protein
VDLVGKCKTDVELREAPSDSVHFLEADDGASGGVCEDESGEVGVVPDRMGRCDERMRSTSSGVHSGLR